SLRHWDLDVLCILVEIDVLKGMANVFDFARRWIPEIPHESGVIAALAGVEHTASCVWPVDHLKFRRPPVDVAAVTHDLVKRVLGMTDRALDTDGRPGCCQNDARQKGHRPNA